MKTAVITGAGSGLGFECARALLARDESWHVVLAVRSPQRGAEAVAALGEPKRCTVVECDLASLKSVHAFVDHVRAATELPPLHAIVCNAGVQVLSGTGTTAEGFEMTFGVNHLGHFALVQGFLGGQERSDPGNVGDQLARPARIVVVSSGTHDPAKHTGMPAPAYTRAADLLYPPRDDGELTPAAGRRRYTTSKLCNVLYAYELDRRLGHGAQDITVNTFDPGLMPGSGLARDYPPLQRLAWRYLMPLMRVFPQVHSTRASGRHLAALAADRRFEGVTGHYFEALKPIQSSADSYDRGKALDLWQTSAHLVSEGAPDAR